MYLTVKDAVKKYSFMTEGSLRWLLFNAEKNGLNKAVVKIGRKVLLSEDDFLKWVESHRVV